MKRSDRLKKMVQAAAANGIVVPAFNVFYLPMIEAICKALIEHDTFGLIEVSRIELEKFQVPSITAAAEEYRRFADPRVTGLHLDHIPVIDEDGLAVDWKPLIEEGIASGYDSVMIDASRLPFEENVAVTAEVVRMAHAEGVLVEAELGSVLGHEAGPLPPYEELFASKAGFTDPDQAREFVAGTGVDWLSVSVGSIHGAIAGAAMNQAKAPAKLDIERVRALREAAGVPLVLHGGSGVRQDYVTDAIRHAALPRSTSPPTSGSRTIARLADGGSVKEAQAAAIETIGAIIREKYGIEGSATRLGDLTSA